MIMVEVKVADLVGPALDWAVAQCEGYSTAGGTNGAPMSVQTGVGIRAPWCPSTDWAQGGPIMYREKIGTDQDDGEWSAYHPRIRPKSRWWRRGPHPLIAGMRCYVASVTGETVRVPAELLG